MVEMLRFERAPMRRTLILLAVWFLPGCSLTPLIDSNVTDYFEVSDQAANRIILLNILRAKDGAPLHFNELSLVRGQVSATATLSAISPFGPEMHATSPRANASLGGTVSSAPSFDVGSLDTQDFTKGVMAPISPATFKFFLDEGIDHRLVLLLLLRGIRTPGNQELVLNAPESSRFVCYSEKLTDLPANGIPSKYRIIANEDPCDSDSKEPEFFGFLRILNHLRRVYATNYALPQRPVGSPFTPDMGNSLRSLTAMDPSKFRLQKLPSGKYQLVLAERHEIVLLCQEPAPGGGDAPAVLTSLSSETEAETIPADACFARASLDWVSGASTLRAPGLIPDADILALRSTLEVIQYVGRILAFQEEGTTAGVERCVTLGFERRDPGCRGNILFHLRHDAIETPISLSYRGQSWAVPASRPCAVSTSCDHTLETMAMIALLLNQNKSAKDIPSTPAFQAVP
jgi:hypothetical protein